MKNLCKGIALAVLLTAVAVPGSAYFEDIGRDARARGMANAMIGIFGNVNSVQYNPAGTARSTSLELNLQWGKPLTMGDLNDGSSFDAMNGTFLMPFTNDVNLSWLIRWLFMGLTLGNEEFMFKDGAMALAFDMRDNAQLVKETMITLNYAKVLDDVLFKGAKLAAGFNIDMYSLAFTKTADWGTLPDNPNDSVFTIGIDLGVIYNFSENIRLAVVFENLLKPNFSVFDGGEDYSPTNVKLGGSIFFPKLIFFENMTVTFNYVTYGKYDSSDNTATKASYHFGFESWWFDNIFAFRGGLQLGDEDMSELSLGISAVLPMGEHLVSFDYAFTLPFGVEGTRHLLALTWKWDLPKYVFEYDPKKAAEMKRLHELEQQRLADEENKKNQTTATNK
ncbi:MAG TPA: hypothetical protein PLD82_01295 [Spirochaetota bacterium]|nr:hypothetical protein [Spirochaetota bacterium]